MNCVAPIICLGSYHVGATVGSSSPAGPRTLRDICRLRSYDPFDLDNKRNDLLFFYEI